MMIILKPLAVGIGAYIGLVLAVLLVPIFAILGLWIGGCVLGSIFLFLFWLLITHSPHTLYSSLYMLAWGSPPFVAATMLGYFGGRLRGRRNAPLMTLRGGAPFR